MALGAYQSEVGRGSVLNALAHPNVVNPVADLGAAVNVATGLTSLRQSQFNLQQAQQGLGYQEMRMLAATNPNPTDDDVNAAYANAARRGGNPDAFVQNYTNFRARGGTAADWVRAQATGGMAPENQFAATVGGLQTRDTGAGILTGLVGGAASPTPGRFTPGSFVQSTLSPAQATDMVQVGVNPDGSAKMVPRWQVSGSGAPGVGPAGGGGGGGGGGPGTGGGPAPAPAGPPPGSSVQPGQPLSQKDQDLATFAQRESGNQNILSRVPVPAGYTQNQAGSGYYQIIPSTWAEGQQLAGIPPAQRTQMAMQASPQQQYAVASALYDKYGGRPWAQSAPQGGGGQGGSTVTAGPGGGQGGPFVGATSAVPVTAAAPVAQPGGGAGANVRPAGGVQTFDPYGRPVAGPGGQGGPPAGGYGGYSGLPATFEKTAGASADMFNAARANYSQQAQRISPLEQSLATLRAHPDLQTGMTAMDFQNLNSLAQVLGVQLSPQTIADGSALTEINKNLNRYYRGLPGANRSDMAELDAKLANPSPENQRDALDDLLARTIGAERMNDAGYMHFLELHGGGNASTYAGQYADQVGQYTSKLDPVGFAFDKQTLQQRRAYYDSLSPTERTRYMSSIKEASRLYNLPIPQGG